MARYPDEWIFFEAERFPLVGLAQGMVLFR